MKIVKRLEKFEYNDDIFLNEKMFSTFLMFYKTRVILFSWLFFWLLTRFFFFCSSKIFLCLFDLCLSRLYLIDIFQVDIFLKFQTKSNHRIIDSAKKFCQPVLIHNIVFYTVFCASNLSLIHFPDFYSCFHRILLISLVYTNFSLRALLSPDPV